MGSDVRKLSLVRVLEVGVDHKLGERLQRGQVGGLALLQQANPNISGASNPTLPEGAADRKSLGSSSVPALTSAVLC